jgi:restriction system-associated AAA family ATPase
MRLLRVRLGVPFRSLPSGFEVHFLREWDYKRSFEFHPYCLAGRNGSGKSNVLEVLAAIFYHIECIYLDYRPEGFEFDAALRQEGFRAENATPDAFELEYLIPAYRGVPREPWPKEDDWPFFHIRITKQAAEAPVVHWINKLRNGETSETLLTRAEVKAYLPTYILGYSSGRNEILSLPFFKMRFIHFDEYRERLTTGVPYGGRPEGRLIYLDEQFSQAILLCHFLFPNEAILKVFDQKISLTGIERFRIIIQRHHRLPVAQAPSKPVSPEESKEEPKATVELTSMLSGYTDKDGKERLGLIDKLIKCSTTQYEDYSPYPDGEGHDLYLDYWVTDATRQAFQFHFSERVEGSEELSQAKSALNLFHGLQTLLTLNHYRVDEESKADLYGSGSLYVNETISTPASHERIMRFKEGSLVKRGVAETIFIKALSDGEHQLLHTIGLCLLFRHEPALFLLDEPETHLNPDWRASYVSTLRAALEADEATKSVMREVLLTSHSPFIVSDCQSENVLVFQKNDDGGVEWHRPDFNTFGASANTITMKVFDRRETIGDFALSKLEDFRHRLDRGENPDMLMTEVGEQLGDSVEKSLFLSQAINKKEDH